MIANHCICVANIISWGGGGYKRRGAKTKAYTQIVRKVNYLIFCYNCSQPDTVRIINMKQHKNDTKQRGPTFNVASLHHMFHPKNKYELSLMQAQHDAGHLVITIYAEPDYQGHHEYVSKIVDFVKHHYRCTLQTTLPQMIPVN